jgi:hypothetical protein
MCRMSEEVSSQQEKDCLNYLCRSETTRFVCSSILFKNSVAVAEDDVKELSHVVRVLDTRRECTASSSLSKDWEVWGRGKEGELRRD